MTSKIDRKKDREKKGSIAMITTSAIVSYKRRRKKTKAIIFSNIFDFSQGRTEKNEKKKFEIKKPEF